MQSHRPPQSGRFAQECTQIMHQVDDPVAGVPASGMSGHLVASVKHHDALDREKVEKLPQEVKEKLIKGEVTPLMEVSLPARNGMVITLPLKLQLAADRDGNPTLIAYPVQRELSPERNNELRLSQQEIDALRRGDVLQKTVDIDGEKTRRYLQLDPETKSIIHRRVTEVQIEQRLKDMEKVNDIELGTQQKQQVREGKPMELNVGGEKVTVGIDLREPQGFRIVQGDMKEWERQQKLRYDDLHPEYFGLVMTDKNRWEYQKVVEHDSKERAIRLDPTQKKHRWKTQARMTP